MFIQRSATGESWQLIMISIQTTTKCDPLSKPSQEDRIGEEDCSSWVAITYFVSFICITSFLVEIKFLIFLLKTILLIIIKF